MLLSRFLPKNPEFLQMFIQSANNAHEMARAFLDLTQNYTDVGAKVRKIKDLEHVGDTLTHNITNALTITFITPFDREDIMALASSMDDFVDAIEECARRMWLYRIAEVTPETRELAQIIAAQAEQLALAMPMVLDSKRTEDLRGIVRKVTSLEDDGDRIVDTVMSNLYEGASGVQDVIRGIRWGELYQYMEDATDRGQDVAYTIEGIILKNA